MEGIRKKKWKDGRRKEEGDAGGIYRAQVVAASLEISREIGRSREEEQEGAGGATKSKSEGTPQGKQIS